MLHNLKVCLSQCHSLIESYGNKIFHFVATIGSEKTCKEIGVCVKSAHTLKKRELLGSNRCTWGPGYWCKSVENAKECGDGVSLTKVAKNLKFYSKT